jgi:DNA helicase HerA-like ATPase
MVPGGQDVEVPVEEILTGRAFVTGKSGSGKSNTTNVIAEEILERGLSLLIVDTMGEYYSLKEEYEVLHAGADAECDLQVQPEHGEKLAELALEDNVPIVLDVSGFFDEEEGDKLIYETIKSLFHKENKKQKPFLVVVEECHEYLAERDHDELSEMMVKVGKEGRKRGLGMFAISQRPADVKKSYITQCDWLIWHRLTWDNDTKVVRRVVNSETADAVTGLENGEAFLQADFLDSDLVKAKMRRMKTFDAGATPTLDGVEVPELKSISDDLVDELEDITEREEQRQDRISELEAELSQREEQIAELEDRVERLKDLREILDSTEGLPDADASDSGQLPADLTLEIDGDQLQDPEVIKAEVMEVQRERDNAQEELEQLRAERDELAQKVEKQKEELSTLQERVDEYEWIDEHLDEMREATRRLSSILDMDDGPSETAVRNRIAEKDERIQELLEEREELEQKVSNLNQQQQGGRADADESPTQDPVVTTDDDQLNRLLAHDTIKQEFIVAVEEGDYADEHYPRHLSTVINAEDGLTPQLAAEILSVSDTLSRTVLRELRNHGLLRAEGERPETFYLDRDRLERRVNVAEQVN